MKINFAGDFNLENRGGEKINRGEKIFGKEFENFWFESDYRIANLESPITKSQTSINKVGRPIKGCINNYLGLKQIGIDFFSLANNHIMDYDVVGLNETINVLQKSNIQYFGVKTGGKVYNYQIIEKDDVKVAICAFTNKEFSIHQDFDGFGALSNDIIKITELLQSLNDVVNHIVLILHTGLSKNPLPSPQQREMCQFFIRQGASVVLCQHSHIIGAYEYYQDGFISYGQGSFIFDLYRNQSTWNLGYTVNITFAKKSFTVKIIGHKQFDDFPGVRLLNEKELSNFENKLNEYNKILNHPESFISYWLNYIEKKRESYFMDIFLPKNKIARRIFRFLPFYEFIPKHNKLLLLNYFRNDEHNEVMQYLLNNK